MTLETIAIIVSFLATFAGLFEWRIRSMYNELHERIKDRDKVHQVVQDNLKEDIARLETKIDMMINLLIRNTYDKKD